MSKQFKAVVLSTSIALVLMVVGGMGVKAAGAEGAYRQLGVFSEVLSRIRSEYVEDPNFKQVTGGALHGLLESLDANSSYLSPEEYKAFRQRPNEGKASAGASLSKRFGYAAVISVIPNGPAAKAGVENGDIIEAIEGRSTRDMSLAEVKAMMTGDPGSRLNLTLVRARRAQPVKATVLRDVVQMPPVSERLMDEGIGYLKVEALNKGKAAELAQKIKSLEQQGAKRLILDLRNTAEGEAEEGVAVANLFLERGTIATLQGQRYNKVEYNADPQKAITKLPVVVMVNRSTAGAAEIVAAAILENARGDVLGDKTFGVGSIQKVIEVPDGSALILSVAKYYSPSGKVIQETAVTPNILVASAEFDELPLEEDGVDGESAPAPTQQQREDEQLRRAVEVLKNSSKKS